MQIQQPYLLFLGDVQDQLAAKTAQGIVDWRRRMVSRPVAPAGLRGRCRHPGHDDRGGGGAGARTLIVGVVNAGGVLPEQWTAPIIEALGAGLDVASGLHTRLAERPEVADAARRYGRRLWICASRASASRREGDEAGRHAAAFGRHGLLRRQEIHGAGAGARDARPRLRRRLPGDGPDRACSSRAGALPSTPWLRISLPAPPNGFRPPPIRVTGI